MHSRHIVYRFPDAPVTLAPARPVETRVLRIGALRWSSVRDLQRFYGSATWAVLALRNADRLSRIWCVYLDGLLVHVTWVVGGRACRRYHFIPKNGCMIGPCITSSAARGQRIYPWVLQCVVASHPKPPGGFWIFHEEDNAASRQGILRAGGVVVGHFNMKTRFHGMLATVDYLPLPQQCG